MERGRNVITKKTKQTDLVSGDTYDFPPLGVCFLRTPYFSDKSSNISCYLLELLEQLQNTACIWHDKIRSKLMFLIVWAVSNYYAPRTELAVPTPSMSPIQEKLKSKIKKHIFGSYRHSPYQGLLLMPGSKQGALHWVFWHHLVEFCYAYFSEKPKSNFF